MVNILKGKHASDNRTPINIVFFDFPFAGVIFLFVFSFYFKSSPDNTKILRKRAKRKKVINKKQKKKGIALKSTRQKIYLFI